MLSTELSEETQRRIDALFPAEAREEVERLLKEQCGKNLPLMERANEFDLERVRFAALKVSESSIARLRQAVELANTDWRDLLVGAGFAEDLQAHRKWLAKP